MTDLTLPGDIPGLLRRGSPVVAFGLRCVVLGPDEPGRWGPWLVASNGDWPDTMGYPAQAVAIRSCRESELALDLTDPTGRAHAAWWALPRFIKRAQRQNLLEREVLGVHRERHALLLDLAMGRDATHDQIATLRALVLRLAGRTDDQQ